MGQSEGVVEQLLPYRVRAHNAATASENKIHADDVARRYGFEGGLVPGTTVYAYMTHPVAEALGRPWVEHGTMTARFLKPFYEGEDVIVEAARSDGDGTSIELTARRPDGEVGATGSALLPAHPSPPPDVAGYPAAPLPAPRPPASREVLSAVDVLGSPEATFHAEAAPAFLDEIGDELPLYVEEGIAHPGYLLQGANWILIANVELGPWIHVGSEVTHFAAAGDGDRVSIRGRVAEIYERKGHQFVELDLLLVANDATPLQHVRHVAIYEVALRA